MRLIMRVIKYINATFWRYVNLVIWTILAILLDAIIFFGGPILYDNYFGDTYVHNKVHEIYRKIIVASGQSNNAVPLFIVKNPTDNAYTDGSKIVVYTGLIDNSTWDGIAYTLGHELAHHQLLHTRAKIFDKDKATEEKAEALADKLGALYMMRAGFNICIAREEWRIKRDTRGNYLGETHPNYSYRYDELNIGCE